MTNYKIYKTRATEEIKQYINDLKNGVLDDIEKQFFYEYYSMLAAQYGLMKMLKKGVRYL